MVILWLKIQFIYGKNILKTQSRNLLGPDFRSTSKFLCNL